MKKESNYFIQLNERLPLSLVPINDKIVASGDSRDRQKIVNETQNLLRQIRSEIPIPESQLTFFQDWSRKSEIPITITRIKRKYTRKSQTVEDEVVLDIIPDEKSKKTKSFKKGDIVKITGNTNNSCNKIGDIGIITSTADGTAFTVEVEGRTGRNGNNTYRTEVEHYIVERVKTDKELKLQLEEKKKIEKTFGCFVSIGTIINSDPLNIYNKNYYTITSITKDRVTMAQKGLETYTGNPYYTIENFNDLLNSRTFTVINTTNEIEKRIGLFNNVVISKDFKTDNKTINLGIIPIKKNGSISNIILSPSFTGNCQLTVISNMVNLIHITSDLKSQLRQIHIFSSRRLLLCDVRSEVFKKLEEKLPKSIFNTVAPYKSTNGSNMVIVILNISNL